MKKFSLLFVILCLCGFSQISHDWNNDNNNYCLPDYPYDTNAPVKDYEQKRDEAYEIHLRTSPNFSDNYMEDANNMIRIGLDLAVVNFRTSINKCLASTSGERIALHTNDDQRHMFRISDNSIIYASINKCKTLDSLRILEASDDWNTLFCTFEFLKPIIGAANVYDLVYGLETERAYEGTKVIAFMEDEFQYGMPAVSISRNIYDPSSAIVGKNCDLNYARACVPISENVLNCDDIPYSNFRVIGIDHHNLDGDKNGIACEPSAQ